MATAEVATGAQLQTLVRDLERVTDTETDGDRPGEDAVAEPDDGFRWYVDEGGRYRWGGSSAPDQGAAIVAAIDAMRSRDLDDAGTGAQPLSNSEALSRVADAYLGGLVDDEGVLAERYLTLLHIRDGAAYLQDGGSVDPAVARLLGCCSWASAVTVLDGHPVTATSRTRLATPTQRRALLVRDRCCQYPGCGRTRHLRAHHVAHREHGGPTRLDNLMLLCSTHHRLIHGPGWQVEGRPRRWRFIRPDGRLVQPVPRPRPGPPPAPSAQSRPTPAGDPLTDFGRDVILHDWLTSA